MRQASFVAFHCWSRGARRISHFRGRVRRHISCFIRRPARCFEAHATIPRGSDLRRIRLKFCREALVWKDLRHPNILPFLGIDRDSFPSSLCMVSPWMNHGTVINYLKNHGYANVNKLLYEIAKGLEYLHSRNIVHGDLRGANILIKEDWSACLTDFGLSIFSDATSTMSTNRGGSLHWMAPELLDPDRFEINFARTPATDVYAFGCVCVELYTARPRSRACPKRQLC
ncbi:kinase-like domain-containing protein [Mycena haematopus]|nr:kinase-like domain-containing protein [Mycena haematopus]